MVISGSVLLSAPDRARITVHVRGAHGRSVRDGPTPQFVPIDIDEQPVPERLEQVEQEAFLAVEETEPDHVAVEEVEERTDEKRKPVPDVLLPPGALVGRSE